MFKCLNSMLSRTVKLTSAQRAEVGFFAGGLNVFYSFRCFLTAFLSFFVVRQSVGPIN